MKKTKPALVLNTQTVLRLTAEQLQAVNGGWYATVCQAAKTYCQCDTSSTLDGNCMRESVQIC
jgi:hypothetical protein